MFMRCFLGLCLVAATAATSSASFIIDSFNGDPTGFTLPGGVTVDSRTVAGGTVTELGTATNVAGNFFTLRYTFSAPLSATGDTLAGTPSLTFDFEDVVGDFQVQFDNESGGGFVNAGSVASGASSFSLSTPTLLSLDSFVVGFSSFTSGANITFDRLTATPEPTSLALVGGLLGFAGLRRRRS